MSDQGKISENLGAYLLGIFANVARLMWMLGADEERDWPRVRGSYVWGSGLMGGVRDLLTWGWAASTGAYVKPRTWRSGWQRGKKVGRHFEEA